jgi:hypothetical protein
MSAFVVDTSEIDLIMTAAIASKVWAPARPDIAALRAATPLQTTPFFPAFAIDQQNATAIGKILLAENIRNVEARYSDMPHTERSAYAEQLAAYSYTKLAKPLDTAAAARALASLDYQCSETDAYDISEARGIIRAIGFALMCRLSRLNA